MTPARPFIDRHFIRIAGFTGLGLSAKLRRPAAQRGHVGAVYFLARVSIGYGSVPCPPLHPPDRYDSIAARIAI